MNRVQVVLSGFIMILFVLSRQKLYVGMDIHIPFGMVCLSAISMS